MSAPAIRTSLSNARSNDSLTKPELFDREYLVPFVMVTALFFLWAIPNNLNDILIRQFMDSFQINRLKAGLVQSAFYMGYFLFSMPAAMVLRRFGYRIGLITGLLLYAGGAFLFWPAAEINRYGAFLFALFLIASGLAFLETGAGSFITQLGDPQTSERRLNLAQAFNPPGTIVGALIGTVFIFSNTKPTPDQISSMKASGQYSGYLHHETMRVIAPYLVLSCIVLVFAIVLLRVRFPSPTLSQQNSPGVQKGSVWTLLRHPHFLQAVVAQFFYVGAQVGTWSYTIQYVQQYVHLSEKSAGYCLSGSLVIFALGRFVATFLMQYFAPNKLMSVYGLINIALLTVAIAFPGWTGLGALLLTSFFMSLMYPTIYALGLKDLGTNTTLGASVIVMAIVGGAVFTPLIGGVAELSKSMATALWIPLAGYVVVAYFGLVGARVRAIRFVRD